MMTWITNAPRHLFFTGKGGVGKTSLACATAIALADKGRRVLLVSTDPASNLDEVLRTKLTSTATPVTGATNLWALNIDPQAAAHAYREKMIGPYRDQLPAAALRSMEEQLSGACTTEIAAFDEFSKLLGDPDATAGYDHVVFDTAPTGHTLRLLTLPGAWTDFMATNTTGATCLGPLAGLQAQQKLYQQSVAALRDATRTVVVLVTRAQLAPLREAQRTSDELAALGVTNQRVVVNGIFRAQQSDDPIATALESRAIIARQTYRDFLARWPVSEVPLRPRNILGIETLRGLLRDEPVASSSAVTRETSFSGIEDLSALVDELAASGRGVIMTMGKGGVGKTTIAAAIAMELARRGHAVTLSTTDPAAHVANVAANVPNLRVTSIDPHRETLAYQADVLATSGRDLDADGRALLEEDLRSPCTEEIAVFRAFARTVAQGTTGFVVLDTAPTGHTLLLLDATEAYHREVSRFGSELPEEVRQLLPRLRDPAFTRMLLVTLPEATPVHEASQLQDDLRRAGIEPFAWIINQSFAVSDTRDPLLLARGRDEAAFIREVTDCLAKRSVLLPWVAREPSGTDGLSQFFNAAVLEETK